MKANKNFLMINNEKSIFINDELSSIKIKNIKKANKIKLFYLKIIKNKYVLC
jgi:hypothetical protein